MAPSPSHHEALTPGSLIYETDASVSQYLEFHYGPSVFGVPNFPKACIDAAAEHGGADGWQRALDVGCAVGRSSFELARYAREVDAFDFSAAFVGACQALQRAGAIRYGITTEGELTEPRTASLAELGLAGVADRVRFAEGDACRINPALTGYDVVFAGNLIDRLYQPAAFLEGIVERLVPGGLLVITSPYTWLEDYTPREQWLGGRVVNGSPQTTLQGMQELLGRCCELVGCRDIPFVIRETARKHQHTLAEASFWRRR
jgi:putative 4-mercaptohistidine N1-methyltranferase